MKHFILVLYLVSFISGISAITIFVMAYIKRNQSHIRYYIIFLVALGALLLEQSISTYSLVNNVSNNAITGIITIMSFISCGCIIYTLPIFIYKLIGFEESQKRNGVLKALACVPIIALICRYIFKNDILVIISNAVLFIVISYCIWMLIKYFSNIKDELIRNCVKLLLILTILVLPYMFLDTKTKYIPLLSDLDFGLLSVPIFYLIWNTINICCVIRYLGKNTVDQESPEIMDSKEKSIEEFYIEYRITNREQEVIELLIKGSSYKEISEQLFISLSTVKTHIRNIYQKTEVKSKIELVNIINQLTARV